MKKYQYILINTIGIFLLSFVCHYMYEWFPNKLTVLFFPVNESIWEHVKMLYTANILWAFFEYFIYKKREVTLDNFFITLLLGSISNLIILLILYLPTYYLLGEHILLTIIILFFSILISQWLIFPINEKKEMKTLNIVCLIFIPLLCSLFGYLTYHPIQCDLFYDRMQEKYGLSTLNK